MGSRKTKRPVEHYATDLPDGVRLLQVSANKTYQLRYGGELLASRPQETVLKWENPKRVFASIARRALRERES